MFCSICGLEEHHNNQFCRACGADILHLEMIEEMRDIISGTVVLDENNVKENLYFIKKRIGIQRQSSAFFPKP